MDVTGIIEKEETRTSEWVIGLSGNFNDSNVIVTGFEFGDGFDVVCRDSVVVGGSFGAVRVGSDKNWVSWRFWPEIES